MSEDLFKGIELVNVSVVKVIAQVVHLPAHSRSLGHIWSPPAPTPVPWDLWVTFCLGIDLYINTPIFMDFFNNQSHIEFTLGTTGVLFECQSLFSICDLSLKNLHLYLNLLLYLYFSLYISMYLCSEMAPPGDLFERQSFGETNIIADPQATIRLTLRHLRIFKNIYRIIKQK